MLLEAEYAKPKILISRDWIGSHFTNTRREIGLIISNNSVARQKTI